MENLISQIKRMWGIVFGDSKEYIDMIIDGYYDRDISEVAMDNDKVVSSSLVIPYCFTNISRNYIGYYLCGLMTIPAKRGSGIMRDIIHKIEKTATRNNADFTFLIPADDRLRKYYGRLGYKNTATRCILTISEKQDNLSKNIKTECKFIEVADSQNIYHTYNDIFQKYHKDECDDICVVLNAKYGEKYLDEVVVALTEYERDIFHIASCNRYKSEHLIRQEDTQCNIQENTQGKTQDNIQVEKQDSISCGQSQSIDNIFICHTASQWRDILKDFMRENASIIISRYGDILIVTQEGKLYPLTGSPMTTWNMIQNVIVAGRNFFDNLDSGFVGQYHVFLTDPEFSNGLLKIIRQDQGGDFEVTKETQFYGMAKSFNENVTESSIIIRMMFD